MQSFLQTWNNVTMCPLIRHSLHCSYHCTCRSWSNIDECEARGCTPPCCENCCARRRRRVNTAIMFIIAGECSLLRPAADSNTSSAHPRVRSRSGCLHIYISTYLHIYISTLLSSETAWEQPHPRNHNKIKIPTPATISPWSYKSSHTVSLLGWTLGIGFCFTLLPARLLTSHPSHAWHLWKVHWTSFSIEKRMNMEYGLERNINSLFECMGSALMYVWCEILIRQFLKESRKPRMSMN